MEYNLEKVNEDSFSLRHPEAYATVRNCSYLSCSHSILFWQHCVKIMYLFDRNSGLKYENIPILHSY